jgi:hypothetical protein
VADKALYSLLIDLKADTAKLQSDMDRAVGILQRSGSLMQNVFKGVFQGIGQAIGQDLIRNVTNLSGALGDLADRGEDVAGVAENFKRLGGTSDSLKRAQDALLGTVTQMDLMKAANDGLVRGIPNLNQNFAKMAEFAGRFADATGRDATEVLNELVKAVGTGSVKALQEFGIQVDGSATKLDRMKQATQQVLEDYDRFAPLTDSVSNAHKAFTVALSDAADQVGMAVNNNEALKTVYRELEGVIRSIDWQQVGEGVASLATSFISLANNILPAIEHINTFALGLEVALGTSARGKFLQLKEEAQALKEELATYEKYAPDSTRMQELAQQTRDRLDAIVQEAAPLYDQLFERNAEAETAHAFKATRQIVEDKEDKEGKAQEKLAKKQSDAAGKLLREEQEARERSYEQSINTWSDLFSQAINGGTQDLGAMLRQVAVDFAAQMAQSVFGNIGGAGGNGSIGGSLAQMIMGTFGSGAGGMSTAQAHAAGVQGPGMADGSFGGGAAAGAAGAFAAGSFMGAGMTGAEAHAAGIQGPAMADGSFGGGSAGGVNPAMGYVAAGTMVVSSALSASDRNKETRSEEGTGAAAGTAIGAAIGTAILPGIGTIIGAYLGQFAGGALGGMIGHGAQNPESRARHLMVNWLEEALKEGPALTLERRDGSRYQFDGNIIEGRSDKFNKPGWAEDFEKEAQGSMRTFTGLGNVIARLSGQVEDVGDQFGYILGENLEFNVDNARKMVRKLGLTYEEMEKEIVAWGIENNKTWLEIEGNLQGAADAAKPGLAAFGDWKSAMDDFIASGGRGWDAIDSLRNIMIEAKEAGIQNLEELRQHMLRTYDPKMVDAFFQALSQRGITSFDQLATASDRTAGGVVADMQALGFAFKEVSDEMGELGDNIGKLADNIGRLSESIGGMSGKSLNLGGEPEAAFATGGVITSPTRALMGEAGPEAVLPLTRRNGKLGVALFDNVRGTAGGGYVINIDARGAEAGVENRIRSMMRETEDRAVRRMARSLSHGRGRAT